MSRQRSGQEASQSRVVCQVCQVDLGSLKQAKAYCLKKKVCPTHLQADVVYLPGRDAPHRFCHQCGKFEPLDCFDGTRRSCRERTFQRRVKYHNQLHPPAAAAQSTTSPSKPRRAAAAADAAVAHPRDAPAKQQQQQLSRPLAPAVAGAQQAQPSATQLLSHLAALVGQNAANPMDPARVQGSSARAGAADHGQTPLPQAGRSSWQGAVLGQEQPFLREPQPQLHLQRAQHPEQFALPQQQLVQPQQQLLQPQQQLVQSQLQQPMRQLPQALLMEPQHLQQDGSGLSRGGDDAQQYVTVGGIRMTGREAQEVVYTLLHRELEKCRQQDDLQLPHFNQHKQQQGQGQGQGSVPLFQPQPTQLQQQQGRQEGDLELLLSGNNASRCSAMEAPVLPASGLALGFGGVGVHSPLAASLAMQGAQAGNLPAPPAPPALPARAVAEATESLLQTVQRLQALLSDPNVGSVNAELITAAATAAAAALAAVEGTGTGVQQAQQAQQHEAHEDRQLGYGRQDQGLLLQQAQQLLVQEQQQLEEESRRLRAAAYADPATAAVAGWGAEQGPNLSLVGPSVPQAMGVHGAHSSAHPAHAVRQQQQGQRNPGVSELIHSLLAALAGQQPGAPLGGSAEARAAAAAADLQLAGRGQRTSNQINPYRPHYQHTALQQQGAATLPRSLSAVIAMLTGDAAASPAGLPGAELAVSPLGSPTVQQRAQEQTHQQQQMYGLSSLSEQLAAAVRASLAESSSGQCAMQASAQTHQQQQGPKSYAQNAAGAVPVHDRGNDLGNMLGSLLGSTSTQPGSRPDQSYQGADPSLAERLANALRGSICGDASAGTPVAGVAAAAAAAAASPTAAGGMGVNVNPAGRSTGAAAPAAHVMHDAGIHAGGMPVAAQAQAVDAGVVPAYSEEQGGQGAPANGAAAQVLAEIYSVLASMSGPQG